MKTVSVLLISLAILNLPLGGEGEANKLAVVTNTQWCFSYILLLSEVHCKWINPHSLLVWYIYRVSLIIIAKNV